MATFSDCSNLTTVNIPTSVTTIKRNAFYGTAFLNNQLNDQGFLIVNGILLDAKNIGGEITIPNTVIKINEAVFAERVALTSVILPDGITEIGDEAFMECKNLVSINIPKSVTSIGRYAFTNVPLVIYDGTATNYSEWGAKKVVRSDGTVLYENTDNSDDDE